MTYRDIINSIKPYGEEDAAKISSNEKLGAVCALYLTEKQVPLTFNYLCVAMFKMFPSVFYCDLDFKEYPSIDRLNRTLMHMTITKKKDESILQGSAKQGYVLTGFGEFVARQSLDILDGHVQSAIKVKVKKDADAHKEGPNKEYAFLVESELHQTYKKTGEIPPFAVWKLFKVTPFTQQSAIKKRISLARIKAKEEGDSTIIELIDKISEVIE